MLRSGVDGAGVGRQDHALQVAQRQQRLVAVVAVDRLRVAGEVLDRRRHIERVARAGACMPSHVGGAHGRGQRRLLGPGLVGPAPPVVAGKVLDRGEVPVPAGRPQRARGRGAAGPSRAGIPGGAHADRLRVQRRLPRVPEAVHRVDPEDQRDVQPRVLDRVLLDHVVLVGPVVAGVAGAALAGRVRSGCSCRPRAPSRCCCRSGIFFMHVGFGMVEARCRRTRVPSVSVRSSTSCWSIWPTFSGKVMAPSSAFTRAWIGLFASSHGAWGTSRHRRRPGR